MKNNCFAFSFIFFLNPISLAISYQYNDSFKRDTIWINHKIESGKTYQNDLEEFKRYNIYMDNYRYISNHNQQDTNGFKLGTNSFCDLTQSEIVKSKFGLKLTNNDKLQINLKASIKQDNTKLKADKSILDLPTRVDWRESNGVSPVQDQGSCGACWAFVTTAVLESHLRIKKRLTNSLSEQNLIDCSEKYGNEGCDGGLMSSAFEYVRDNHGMNPDNIYGYIGAMGQCKYLASQALGQVTSYFSLATNENELMRAVATKGPVAVGIDAEHKSFTMYKSGVFFDPVCSSTGLNHAVLVIGYGTENGKDYWLIKNSWGTLWGEGGFGKIARNRNNHCGIASLAGYPILTA